MKIIFASFLFLIVCSGFVFALEPTHWRGENASGIYSVENLMTEWPASGPQILWTASGFGEGYTSPVFANNKIYVTGMIDGQAVLFVLDQAGKKLNQYKFGKEFDTSYPGTRSTPTIDENLAYLLTGNGLLTCLDLNSGKPVWKKDFLSDMDGKNITWGYTESLVVEGNRLYCTPGGKTNNVMALDRMTGATIWNCSGLSELSAYCTPQLINLPDRELLVTHTANHVLGIDANTGELLWSFPHTNQWLVHPNSPIYAAGKIFVFSGWGQGAEMLKLSADGRSVTKQFDIKSFDSRMGGAVLLNGYLYGSGDADRSWQCIDWKTGEQKYSSKAVGQGVIIAANHKLIGYSERGELFMANANPSGLQIISKTKVTLGTGPHWAHPVIHGGILYVRHGDTLIAYKISG